MQLAHYGIGLEALRAAIGTVNVNQPKGYLQDDERRWSVSATDQLFGAGAYAPPILATDRGPGSLAPGPSGVPPAGGGGLREIQAGTTGPAGRRQTGAAG